MSQRQRQLKRVSYPTRCEYYPRLGHRSFLSGHHILIFGGINYYDNYCYSLLKICTETLMIEMIPSKNSLPIEGFSLFSFQKTLYFWAGRGPSHVNSKISKITSDLWTYDGQEFIKLAQKGTLPAPRTCHASALIAHRYLLIYGGSGETQIFNDWFILDCQLFQWKEVVVKGDPLPLNLLPQLVWCCGRGILVLGQIYDAVAKKVCYQNLIYQIKITNLRNKEIVVTIINPAVELPPQAHRGSPSICFIDSSSPLILMVGGDRLPQPKRQVVASNDLSTKFQTDAYIFNLQTLEWYSSNLRISNIYGSNLVKYEDKIILVGGIGREGKDLSNMIQTIDFGMESPDAKFCSTCQEIYGIKRWRENTHGIVFKFQQKQRKSYINGGFIKKIAMGIRNPISAFGLLMDNSFNLGATIVQLEFKQMTPRGGGKPPTTFYDYIKVSDNSSGFNREQILQTFYNFIYKVEIETSDKKFQEQLAIRKEYGINLKLGALRLGNSCLFCTKSIHGELFIGYFSCKRSHFIVYYYFVTEEGEVSDIYSKNLIKSEVYEPIFLQANEPSHLFSTNCYIFEPQKAFDCDPSYIISNKILDLSLKTGTNSTFTSLQKYLKCLYLNPYIGRTLKLEEVQVRFLNILQILKKDHQEGKIQFLDLQSVDNFFEKILLFWLNQQNYPLKEVLVYFQNRLICSFQAKGRQICGVIQLPSNVCSDISKSRIQKMFEESQIQTLLNKIVEKNKKNNFESIYSTSCSKNRKKLTPSLMY